MAGPGSAVNHELIDAKDISGPQGEDPRIGTVYFPAGLDRLGVGVVLPRHRQARRANGARIRLAPQKDWAVNNPPELAKVLKTLEGIQKAFNDAQAAEEESLAGRPDRARRMCSRREGGKGRRTRCEGAVHARTHGRVAGANRCGIVRRAGAGRDGFRNSSGEGHEVPAEHLLIERALRLTLSAPEMTVLIGGLRALNANTAQSKVGVLTKRPGR